MYTISKIIACLNPLHKWINKIDSLIEVFSYDTRKIRQGENNMFFALLGHRDGHQFIAEAYNKSVRNFVISDSSFDITPYTDANFLLVNDALSAMQTLARMHREDLKFPVIGITGSNGKTIVKEWLSELLQPDNTIYQSPKSYNSQLGVALSLWNVPFETDIAIIEAGISKVGEMKRLADIIQPSIGIFTSLGPAHREGFESKEIKLKEKWELFNTTTQIIAPSNQLSAEFLLDERLVTWGNLTDDDLRILNIQVGDTNSKIELVYKDDFFELKIPFVDRASVDNVLTCVLTMLVFGYAPSVVAERISILKPLDMRLQLKKGKFNSSIIDDSYSNDISSLRIALDFLAQQNQHEQKILILSDFEGEQWSQKFISKLTTLLNSLTLSKIIFVGERIKNLKLNSNSTIQYFDSTNDLLAGISSSDFANSIVLIKGARKFELDKVSRKLTEKSHETVLQINLNALEHNLKSYREKLDSRVKMMAMVKAFSYGSGSFEVANLLQFNNIDYLTVAFVDEGVELRRTGVKLPIMVLSPHESAFEEILQNNLEPEIYSIRILKSFIAYLDNADVYHYPIHIKLDTGMHRLGFMGDEIDELSSLLQNQQQVKVQSVFSHLVAAGDEKFLNFTHQQIVLYNQLSGRIRDAIGYNFIRHICNTSGILHHPEAHMDMVRLGIGLYGFDMNPKDIELQQVSVLKTTITQIKKLKKNETVGYDRRGVLHRDSVIATVKIGYADGYDRRFGNGVGQMMVNGEFVRTVGNICMDMCMLDVTDIAAQEGDEVIVFPDMMDAASAVGTIPYELLTGISSRVKRVYYYE